MKMNKVSRMLELGAGHGRISIFFASNGIEKIDALDYSVVAIQLLEKTAKEKGLSTTIYPHLFNVKNPFPFKMIIMMQYIRTCFLTCVPKELHFILSEIRRTLKPKGLNFFSVRNQNDNSYGKGIQVENGIYDMNGFQIRFFTEKEILDLVELEYFKILWIKEEYEEPVTLYLVCSKKLESHGYLI
jgi:SAM-dependent methyltransferase